MIYICVLNVKPKAKKMKIKSLILILMLGLFSFAVMAKPDYKPDKQKAQYETVIGFECEKIASFEVVNYFDFSYNKFILCDKEFIYIKNTQNQNSKISEKINYNNARYLGEIPITSIKFTILEIKYKSKEPASKYRQSINNIKIDLV